MTMRIVNSFVLELREYKGTSIVTRIKFDNSTTIENLNESKGYHGMTKEHWQKLDAELVKLYYKLSDDVPNDCQFREKLIKLDEYNVHITISSISMKALLECFDYTTLEFKNRPIALDLLIRHRKKVKNAPPRANMLVSPSHSAVDEFEYCPQPVSNVSSYIDTSSLLYVPTKIVNKASNSNRENFDVDEEYYSPELTNENHLPVYKPMPIKKNCNKLPKMDKKKQKLCFLSNKVETPKNKLIIDQQIGPHHRSVPEENSFCMLKEKFDGSHCQKSQYDDNQLRCIQLERDVGKSQVLQLDKTDIKTQEERRMRKKNTKAKQHEDTSQAFKSGCIEKGKAVSKTMKDIFGSEPESDNS